MNLAPTPRDTLFTDGTASLYRFRPQRQLVDRAPVLLVPSMINRWYVLDLREGASLVEAFVAAGLDTYLLDWGIPNDEDRYLTWDDVLARLHRFVRATKRFADAKKIGLLGYCMGGTLAGIHTALHPEDIAGLVNLVGPFDFAQAGMLAEMVDARWFDPRALTAPGNISPKQMQDGFISLRPTAQISKWVGLLDKAFDPEFRDSFKALEAWAGDNIPFPGEAYVTYIEELYQKNTLMSGQHWVGGRHADLGAITCPVLTICASKDNICPQPAADGLNRMCSSDDEQVMVIPGGHVGVVVGSKAKQVTYPALIEWFVSRLPKPSVSKEAVQSAVAEPVVSAEAVGVAPAVDEPASEAAKLASGEGAEKSTRPKGAQKKAPAKKVVAKTAAKKTAPKKEATPKSSRSAAKPVESEEKSVTPVEKAALDGQA